jgi:hypothetical protein
MKSRDLFVLGVFLFLLVRTSVAQPIQVHFEASSDSSTFTRYSPTFGLVLWNGSIGVGGSGGISTSNDTEFVHPQTFDLPDTSDSATVSIAFKTGTLSPDPPAARARIASTFLTSRLAGPSSATNDFTLQAYLTRDTDGYWFGVRPETPFGIGQPIIPYLESSLPSAPLSNHWYEFSLTATRINSSGQVAYDSHIRSLGPTGLTPGAILISDSNTVPVEYLITSQPNLYGGFSANGGNSYVSAIDEFKLNAPGIGPDIHTHTVGPTFDAQLRPGNAFPLGDFHAVELDIDGGSGTSFPVLDALIEFPIAEIPANAIISSAKLTIDPLQSASMVIQARGYAGDGLASLTDETATTMLLGQSTGTINSATNVNIPLDVAFVESLLGEASHLGLRLRSQTAGPFTRIASMESTVGTAPSLTIEYTLPGLAGDYNNDGTVDAGDYILWRKNAGAQAGYNDWRTNFGATSNPGSGAASAADLTSSVVPEPTSAVLLVFGIAIVCNRTSSARLQGNRLNKASSEA